MSEEDTSEDILDALQNVNSGPMRSRRASGRRSPPRIVTLSTTPIVTKKTGVVSEPIKETRAREKSMDTPEYPEEFIFLETVKIRPEPLPSTPLSSVTSTRNFEQKSPPVQARKKSQTGTYLFSSPPRLVRLQERGHGTPSRRATPSAQYRENSSRRKNRQGLKANGLGLEPGQTHIWKWTPPKRRSKIDATYNTPKLSVTGDQGVRIVFMTYSGKPIKDIEFVCGEEAFEIPVPLKTRFVAAIGLGGKGNLSKNLVPGTGSITTTYSTLNRAGVGFQSSNLLHQVGMASFLCRGGALECNTINTGVMRKSGTVSFPARHVIGIQNQMSITLPKSIDSLVLIYSSDDESTPTIELNGWAAPSSPILLSRNSSQASIWSLNSEEDGSESGEISITSLDSCRVESAIGLKGEASVWAEHLEHNSWGDLVEEGPLSPIGSATLRWIVSERGVANESR